MKKRTWLLVIAFMATWILSGIVFSFFHSLQQDPITKTQQVSLEVILAPDFTLAVTPPSITSPINRTVAYNASVTSVNGFTGEVVFSISGNPAGTTVSIFPSDTLTLGAGETMGVQIDVMIPDDVNLVGIYTLTVTADSTNYN
ncbi:MAG: hypothetical protein KAR20_23725 [Candidatus Heimdallarchaeota archaeon]|nr:hypothetical protein [Candidatus Heimdallarchaeota archaeon]